MRIGAAARACGISPKMIRYYERAGLIPPPTRTLSGHRIYAEDDVRTLRFVHRARHLGFSVTDAAVLLRLWRDEARTSANVKDLALRRAIDLERRAATLADAAASLRDLAETCPGDAGPECPLLDALATDPGRPGGMIGGQLARTRRDPLAGMTSLSRDVARSRVFALAYLRPRGCSLRCDAYQCRRAVLPGWVRSERRSWSQRAVSKAGLSPGASGAAPRSAAAQRSSISASVPPSTALMP